MNDVTRAIAEKVPVALDLIVSKASGLKLRIENLQCRAIDAKLDSMEPMKIEEGAIGLLAILHIIQELDTCVDEIQILTDDVLDLLCITQPSNLQ